MDVWNSMVTGPPRMEDLSDKEQAAAKLLRDGNSAFRVQDYGEVLHSCSSPHRELGILLWMAELVLASCISYWWAARVVGGRWWG